MFQGVCPMSGVRHPTPREIGRLEDCYPFVTRATLPKEWRDLLVTLARVDAVMEMSWSMRGSSGSAVASETQVTIHVTEGTRESVTHVLCYQPHQPAQGLFLLSRP